MRFATVVLPNGDRVATVESDVGRHPIPGMSVAELVRRSLPAALEIGAAAIVSEAPLDDAGSVLDVPLRPTTIRDFVTFAEHVEGVRTSMQGASGIPEAWYDAPHFYFTNPHTVTGPNVPITIPDGCEQLDFELEVAVVVGRAGTDLTVDEAADHIFGYTILNDWSARDIQRREMQVGLGPAKGKDFANTLGPVLVTADEFGASTDDDGFLSLECVAAVNGVEVGRDVLSNMGWTFPAMIAYASRNSRVEPGDVLGSGTMGNGGCLAELWGRRGRLDPPALQPGDVVSLAVEGIGTLSNTVAASESRVPQVPGARRDRDPRDARQARSGVGAVP
ncbi:fumarylacetoacetate hydrolase family protein [Gordonia insulae]|uniref:Ureidoglycolate lyase n=1 Tax=Gordonia insulae TaxID=2420509 RepID=A0A3G8JME9_9ACTN|nr:fumarylacetoacetate hydrolase family protein [Gordonia insulae]AZG46246.1 Ureidoglycolate lyase [Gordonia insulae]